MPGLRLDTSGFNAARADSRANRARKLDGSYGITTVVPMPEPTQRTINAFLDELIRRQRFTPVQPTLTNLGNKFLDGQGIDRSDDAQVISPIEHLHTTIAAWQVMDAVNDTQWCNELIRSKLCSEITRTGLDVFADGFYRSLIYDEDTDQPTDQYIANLSKYIHAAGDGIDQHKMQTLLKRAVETHEHDYLVDLNVDNIASFELRAASIKLNNDGNIIIQWQPSSELKKFRQELCKHGGMAKRGEAIGTTIAYFPNWDKLSVIERQSVQDELERMLANGAFCHSIHIDRLTQMQIEPEQLRQVLFSRNNLAESSANWQTSVAIFDRGHRLNSQCLSIKSFANVKRELGTFQNPVQVQEHTFSTYKTKYGEVLGPLSDKGTGNKDDEVTFGPKKD